MYEEAGNSNLLMLLNTAIYPFVAAVVFTLLGKASSKLSFIGLAAGFLVGLNLIHTGLNFPPSKALDFLVVTTLLGAIVTLSRSLTSFGKHPVVSIAALAISFYLLLNPVLQHQSQFVSIIWTLACTAIVLVVMSSQSLTANPAHSHAPVTSLAIVAAASAPVVSIGGSLLIGQLLGVFAASAAALVLVSKFILKQSSTSSLPVASFILAGLLAQAHVLADLPIAVVLVAYLGLLINSLANLVWDENGSVIRTIQVLIPQAVVSAVIAGLSLWSVWPESSLY